MLPEFLLILGLVLTPMTLGMLAFSKQVDFKNTCVKLAFQEARDQLYQKQKHIRYTHPCPNGSPEQITLRALDEDP